MIQCINCPSKSFLFQHLTDEELVFVNKHVIKKKYRRGEIILQEGDIITDFIYLREGLLKLYYTLPDKSTKIISLSHPLDFVGVLNVFANKNYIYSISAVEESFLCMIEMKVIRQMIQQNGKFAMRMIEMMSNTSDKIIKFRFDLSSKNLPGKVAYILLDFANNIYKQDEYNLPVVRREIAELTGVSTENVIRALSQFKKEGLISTSGKSIKILNKSSLERIKDHG